MGPSQPGARLTPTHKAPAPAAFRLPVARSPEDRLGVLVDLAATRPCDICGHEFPAVDLVHRSERRPPQYLGTISGTWVPAGAFGVMALTLRRQSVWVCDGDAAYLDSLRSPVARAIGKIKRRRHRGP